MTKIEINKNNNLVKNIIISGHSGYDVEGKDIVCAGISSIMITTVNAILRIDETAISYDKKNGYVKLEILHSNETIDLLIENMISLFKEMELQYKKYVNVNEEV